MILVSLLAPCSDIVANATVYFTRLVVLWQVVRVYMRLLRREVQTRALVPHCVGTFLLGVRMWDCRAHGGQLGE